MSSMHEGRKKEKVGGEGGGRKRKRGRKGPREREGRVAGL